MRAILRFVLGLLLSALLFSDLTFAQGAQAGGIVGAVKDPSGAAVAGATISIVNESTKSPERTVNSNSEGLFSTPSLAPGDYTVKIQARGFRTYSVRVTVAIGETERVNASLEVGGEAQTVTVEANPTLINVESPVMGQPIDAHTLEALPLASPNFLFLLSLSSGTMGELPDVRSTANGGRGNIDITVNGQRTTNNSVTLEGISVNDFNLAHFDTVPLPNPDAVEELKVSTSLYDAASGTKGGGAVGLVLKTGSKNWHGDLYGSYRNDALNANEWFFNHNGLPRQKLLNNVFGASASGPVPFLKGFWFANYQGIRAKNGVSPNGSSTTVTSPIFPTNSDGSTSAALLAPISPTVDPTALNILNLKTSYYGGTYLIPRVGQPGCKANALNTFLTCQFSQIAPIQDDQYAISYDRPLRDNDKVSGRWFYDNGTVSSPLGTNSQLAFPLLGAQKNRFAAISEIHQFSNRQINEFRFGFSRFVSSTTPTDILKLSDIGATRPNQATVPGIYRVNITGAFTFGTGVNDDRGTVSNSFYWGDTWSMAVGKHSLKAGGEAIRYQLNRYNRFALRGDIGFSSFANFVSGKIDTEQSATGDPQRYFRDTDYSLFFQDDYRVTPTLTLNLGLRWDPMGFAHDKELRGNIFDPNIVKANPNANPFLFAQNIALPGLTGTRGIGDCGIRNCRAWKNFGPRIGLAWDPWNNQKTVIRGGYGIYFQRLSNQNLLQGSLGAPFFVQTVLNSPQGVTLQNPLPGAPASGLVSAAFIPQASHFVGISGNGDPNNFNNNPLFQNDQGQLCRNYGGTADNCSINLASFSTPTPTVRTPYNQQWNLTVQRELGKAWALEIGYVGAHYAQGIGIYNPFQAALASPANPITLKDINGKSYTITTNTVNNEPLRYQALGLARKSGARIDGNFGFAIYHSAQVTLSHRFQNGLYFQSAYTYSKEIDDVSGSQSTDELNNTQNGQNGGNIYNDQSNPAQNRARGDFDRPHRLVTSYDYQIPVPKQGLLGTQVFQGWSVSGILTFQNGLPFSVTDSFGGRTFGASNTSSTGVFTCGSINNAYTRGSIQRRIGGSAAAPYLNISCFTTSPLAPNIGNSPTALGNSLTPTLFGNTPRNAFRGPFQSNIDFSVSKKVTFFERHEVDFRADFFNLPNHPAFRQPHFVAITTPSTFGLIDSTVNPARLIQFGMRYSF